MYQYIKTVPFLLGMVSIIPIVPTLYKQKILKTFPDNKNPQSPQVTLWSSNYFSTSSIASLLYWLKLTLMPSASSTESIVNGRSSP